jgi:hypothetical protein
MKPQMRDYQKEFIYDPMMRVMNERIEHANSGTLTKDTPKVLELSTSAGKTFTACNFVIPEIVEMGCDVIYTIPNAASIGEVCEDLQNILPDHLVWAEQSVFGGEFEMPYLKPGQQMVIVSYPTVLSQDTELFTKLSKSRKIVIISDEAHKGLSCPDPKWTTIAFGTYIKDHEANWFDAMSGMDLVAWFMVSATPLRSVYVADDVYEVISSFMNRDILYKTHKSVKSVLFFDTGYKFSTREVREAKSVINNSGYMSFVENGLSSRQNGSMRLNKEFTDRMKIEDEWLEKVTKEYDLPKTKPARIIQISDNNDGQQIFNTLGQTGLQPVITTTHDKKVYGFAKPNYQREFKQNIPKSAQIISFVGNYDNPFTCLVANQIVGEAVNLRNSTLMISEHVRSSKRDMEVTYAVEQLLGRMNRWPEVDGITNWDEAMDYRELRISQGVPRYVMEKWIDMVFSYDLYLAFSPINVSGAQVFFSKHTYNPVEWVNVLKSHEIKSRAKYGNRMIGEKSAWAQEGSQEYKAYRDENPQCEACPKNENGIPVCEAAYEGRVDKEIIYQSNEVHHVDGNHENNDYDNLITLCHVAHFDISVAEKHHHNKKYRPEAA